jgi:hypothetical protein
MFKAMEWLTNPRGTESPRSFEQNFRRPGVKFAVRSGSGSKGRPPTPPEKATSATERFGNALARGPNRALHAVGEIVPWLETGRDRRMG